MSEIVDLSRAPPSGVVKTDILVVGSGSGGATAARLLAEAGREVVVLEEGPDRTGLQLTQRDGEMYDQLYMDRGGRATDDLSVTILQGRVLGGGGVINASDVVPMSAGVLQHWRERFGLSSFTDDAIAPHARAALQDLFANQIRDEQVNRNNSLLKLGAEKLQLKGEVMRHNRLGCAGLGTCLLGCPLNAKKNPRLVAIPAALAAGARVFVRARAVHIKGADQETKTIEVRTLDEKGYHETGSFEVRARTVILAANAIGSTQLLLRSGLGNAHVGRHLSLQPQLPIIARFKEPVIGFRGIPQSYAVTEAELEHHPEYGLWGFRVEGIFGTPGIVATLLPASGVEAKTLMQGYPHYAAALLLVPDLPSGRIELHDDGSPRVHYEHLENHKERLREAIKMAGRIYLAAGAEWVQVPLARPFLARTEAELEKADELEFPPATAPLLSAHQQGGVRFAPSEKDGAANPEGEVYGTRGVYVFDSSGYPSTASSHTMTPIITTSRFLTAQLLAR